MNEPSKLSMLRNIACLCCFICLVDIAQADFALPNLFNSPPPAPTDLQQKYPQLSSTFLNNAHTSAASAAPAIVGQPLPHPGPTSSGSGLSAMFGSPRPENAQSAMQAATLEGMSKSVCGA